MSDRPSRKVFNRWDVLAKGWYAVARADHLRGPTAVYVGPHKLVVWRGADGAARAVDGWCPHLGTGLEIGSVQGDDLRCFFHHWTFDGGGRCVRIPAQPEIPERAHTRGWPVAERYGLIWVWPDTSAPYGVPDFPGLEGRDVVWQHGPTLERACHPHVCMINGLDVQHLATVHGLRLDVAVEMAERPELGVLDIRLAGAPPTDSLAGRLSHAALGGHYAYSMRYQGGTLGLLTTVQDTRLLGRVALPEVRMLFAYLPTPRGTTQVWPVFIAPRGATLPGRALSAALLTTMRAGYAVLRDADALIYDHIRFQTHNLLAIDAPLGRFFRWVDHLEPSPWIQPPPSAPGAA
jgi:phenylpropionate dioxygenase-like ring-hydroxylating dioxygenase large terminal subunit